MCDDGYPREYSDEPESAYKGVQPEEESSFFTKLILVFGILLLSVVMLQISWEIRELHEDMVKISEGMSHMENEIYKITKTLEMQIKDQEEISVSPVQ